jgi:hypothetical protein
MGFIKIPGIDISDADAALADVLNPKTFYSVAAPRKTGSMPTVAIVAGSNAYPQGYHEGDALGLKHVDPNLQAAFIVAGVNIFGTVGTSGMFDRWVPVTIGMGAPTVVADTPNHTDSEPAPLASQHIETYGDLPANGIKQRTPTIILPDAQAVMAAPDKTDNETAPISSQIGLKKVVDGAGIHEEGVGDTDETTEAQNDTVNDMTLMLAAPTVDDAYYFGFNYPWDILWLNIGTAGVGNWAITEEYWNGAAWVACVDGVSDMNQFMVSGLKSFRHTPQGDWATVAWNGLTWYWVRFRVSAFVNIVTQPLGTQAWCEKLI